MAQQRVINSRIDDGPLGTTNKKAAQIFACQCGRNYYTFSAVYLHAKLKHNLRLSNKGPSQSYKVEIVDNKQVKTYFLKQQISNQAVITQNYDNDRCLYFTTIIQRYATLLTNPFHHQIMKLFISYFQAISQNLINDETLPNDIPHYFNDFFLAHLPKAGKNYQQSARKHRQALINFWRWLKANKLTSVELQISDAYLQWERSQ